MRLPGRERTEPALDYLLVARHASRREPQELEAVASRVRQTMAELNDSGRPLEVAMVVDAGGTESSATAARLRRALRRTAPPPRSRAPTRSENDALRLGPTLFPPYAPQKAETAVSRARSEIDGQLECLSDVPGRTLLIVGHEPAIAWVFEKRVKPPLTLHRAEVACLVRRRGSRSWDRGRPKWRIWWTIAPVAPGEVDALRSKIASKLNVVSVLAGFTTAVMSAVLVQLLSKDDASSVAFAAVALYALAAILLVMSLLAYDQLTMPERFWAARRSTRRPSVLHTFPVARPPSSALRVLQQHAVRIWTSVVVALVIDALATWVLAAAALSPLGRWDKAALAVAAIVGVVVVCVWRDVFGPDLGVSD